MIKIFPAGMNTVSLVNYALVEIGKSFIYRKAWVVFDKDDYTNEQFNSAIILANNNNIDVAWSNEAFELWFINHFEYLCTRISRKQLCSKLNEYFLKNKKGKYIKNR